MRKLLALLLLIFSLSACNNVEDPRPFIQGEVDAVFFRSNDQFANVNNSIITIQGFDFDELKLTIDGLTTGSYNLAPGSGNSASFVREGNTYTTLGTDTSGMIEIEEITPFYITGSFYFEARRNGIGERLNFSKGFFYQIPIVGAGLPGDGE